TLVGPQRGKSAADPVDMGRMLARGALLAMLAVIGVPAGASALTIHGGPFYAGTGGGAGTCTVSGNACTNAGATVICSGLNPASFQNLYYGIKNNAFVDGVKQVGTGGPVAGTDQFKNGTGAGPITYNGTTQVHNNITGTNQNVNTALELAVSAGSVTVV